MNKLTVSAYFALVIGAYMIVWGYLFRVLLAWRGFGTTPAGQGLAAITL